MAKHITAVLLALVLTPLPHLTSAPALAAQLGCNDDDLIALYPGYPGFRGYLPDTVGALDWVCPDELPSRFDPSDENEENEEAAVRLDISGSIGDWTWENWMAIEAERGLRPTCYSCAIFNPPVFPPYEPLQRIDREGDARYLLGFGPEAPNITYRWFVEKGWPIANVGDALTDYQLRAIATMHADGDYLNAPEVLRFAEDYLECRYTAVGTPCSPRPDHDQMCQSLIEHRGYAPTPNGATKED